MNIQKTITRVFRKGIKSKLVNDIMDLLSKEGYRPVFEDDYVVFKIEGTTLCFSFDKQDVHFTRLILPNFYEVTGENKVLALYNMNYLNRGYKFATLEMENEIVSAFIDMLLFPASIEEIVPRMIHCVMGIGKDFLREMEKGYSCN